MTDTRKPFECLKCGTCCRMLQHVDALSDYDRGDGVCRYLDEETDLCKIYLIRPTICRVDEVYNFVSDKMSWDEYVEASRQACIELRKLRGIEPVG